MPGPQSNLSWLALRSYSIFFVRGEGAHLWDVDGNDYIDYMAGAGHGILGHGNKEYLNTLKKQLDTLYYLPILAQTPLEIELSKKFQQYVPCAERVRYLLSGTEAVQLAIRLARAYTKRRYFIRFEGHYHGWLDNVLGGLANYDYSDKPFAIDSDKDPVKTAGRDPAAFEQSFKIPWNDIEILERVLERWGEEVAMIHMEPIVCNFGALPPRPGYLEKVRELCNRYGIVLSFDEIITGFRVDIGGAQRLLGVTPDIATFGKALAGGIPMSAVAGKKEIMDALTDCRVVGAGTFNGYPFGVAAALTTISILEKDNGAVYKKIETNQNRLTSGFKEISNRRGIPALVQGPRGCFYFLLVDKEIAYTAQDLNEADQEKHKKLRLLLLDEGLITLHRGRWYVTAGLTEADVDTTLEAVDRALGKL